MVFPDWDGMGEGSSDSKAGQDPKPFLSDVSFALVLCSQI